MNNPIKNKKYFSIYKLVKIIIINIIFQFIFFQFCITENIKEINLKCMEIYETILQTPKINELMNILKIEPNATYGTSGFRKESSSGELIPIIHRCTLFSYNHSINNYKVVLNNKELYFCPQSTGIIITASHNPIKDNGIKLISTNGRLLNEKEIEICEEFVNKKINNFFNNEMGILLVFRDTRPSGEELIKEIEKIGKLINYKIINCGIVSTPLAHFIVYEFNKQLKILNNLSDPLNKLTQSIKKKGLKINIPSIENIKEKYFQIMKNFLNFIPSLNNNPNLSLEFDYLKIYYDSANGVSENIINSFNKIINKDFMKLITPSGILNENCGAEYFKYYGLPSNFNFNNKKDELLVSFDGDMDRIIFLKENYIFDGDDLIVNFSEFILNTFNKNKIKANIGIIISDYTNLGCFNFLNKLSLNIKKKSNNLLKINIIRAKTGIANFINEGLKYDLSIYFEPNGHGGIIFSNEFYFPEEINCKDLLIIKESRNIFHPLIGDPLSVLLFSLKIGFFNKKFEKTPSILKNIHLNNKDILNKLNLNIKLFEDLKCICKECKIKENHFIKNRIFIRPSGTEPLIRIFIESECENNIKVISKQIDELLID